MKETEYKEIENISKIASREMMDEFSLELDRRFELLAEKFDRRDEKLLESMVLKMKPILGDFKDKAVKEANGVTKGLVERIFNIEIDNTDHISKVQQRHVFIDKMMDDSERSRITIRQLVTQRIAVLVGALIIFGAGVVISDFAKFQQDYTRFFHR